LTDLSEGFDLGGFSVEDPSSSSEVSSSESSASVCILYFFLLLLSFLLQSCFLSYNMFLRHKGYVEFEVALEEDESPGRLQVETYGPIGGEFTHIPASCWLEIDWKGNRLPGVWTGIPPEVELASRTGC